MKKRTIKRRNRKTPFNSLKKARIIVRTLQRTSVSPFELGTLANIPSAKANQIISLEGHYFGPGGLGEEKYIQRVSNILKK